MRTIWKYPLEIKDQQTIQVPCAVIDLYTAMKIKEQILKLDVQDGNPCLWIMVDTKYIKRDVVITMCGTGHRCYEPIEDYVDSFQVPPFVYHVFVREGD